MDRMICDFQVVGPVQTNCYFFYHEDSKECILIDPGDEFDRIERYVEKKGLKVTAVLLTHGHFDHIMALKKVKERYGAPVYAAREEQPVLEDPVKNLSGAMGGTPVVEQADVYLEDGQESEDTLYFDAGAYLRRHVLLCAE